jgi:hypothetical protein
MGQGRKAELREYDTELVRCRIVDSERVSYCGSSRALVFMRHRIFFLNSK